MLIFVRIFYCSNRNEPRILAYNAVNFRDLSKSYGKHAYPLLSLVFYEYVISDGFVI